MDELTDYLKNHPRMIGALFTILLVLSQAGTAAATNYNFAGP
ncbi:DUF7503 family protein [Natronorubrum thiooxidans]|uniref:Uncharacterized protein n=1 Tax=Natronorubrum thiooxidans TaxID=308853 RepID=A0A1N7G9Y5_9EURY|nr:hypothetical protein [Natronorubrum thiooxidans]SIS09324.1 hypothetical protein SAMN05421752_110154 [Natronorubrum thiooxidans]